MRSATIHDGSEIVKAMAVPFYDASKVEFISFCRERLSAYKVPSHIEFPTQFPQTSSGKVWHPLSNPPETGDVTYCFIKSQAVGE